LFERLAAIDEEDDDGKPPALRFSVDAQDYYFDWQAKLDTMLATSEEHVSVRSHFAKYASLMPALALLCHLADGPGAEHRPVTLWAAQQAAGWCDYLRSHANRIYSLVGAGDRLAAGEIAKWIKNGKLTGEMSAREVYRRLQRLSPEDVKLGLDLLDELGWVRLTYKKAGPRGGRPQELVTVNPRARAV
jgi:putative DNA primase/helicase